jgi:chemotaxis protein CheD
MAAPTFESSRSGLATRHCFVPNSGRNTVKLRPGEYSIADENVVVVPVLGACVAACLRGPYTGLGGMKRFMPPKADGATELLSRRPCL